jgi:hypothetical protein
VFASAYVLASLSECESAFLLECVSVSRLGYRLVSLLECRLVFASAYVMECLSEYELAFLLEC